MDTSRVVSSTRPVSPTMGTIVSNPFFMSHADGTVLFYGKGREDGRSTTGPTAYRVPPRPLTNGPDDPAPPIEEIRWLWNETIWTVSLLLIPHQRCWIP